MKRNIALSLVALLSASASFAGGGDLYATKGCHQEYNGYWGVGAGWNRDNNEFRVEDHSAFRSSTHKFSAKEAKSTFVGHFFLGYNLYNDAAFSVALESGMYTSGKEVSKTKVVTSNINTVEVTKGKAKREPAYYLALKPRYNSGDWWVNITLGGAATSFRVKANDYNTNLLTGTTLANATYFTKDGFVTYGWMLGAGVGMYFTPNWSLSLDYDYMNWSKESSKTVRRYNAGSLAFETTSAIKDGSSSHFVTLNLKNNFNWFS